MKLLKNKTTNRFENKTYLKPLISLSGIFKSQNLKLAAILLTAIPIICAWSFWPKKKEIEDFPFVKELFIKAGIESYVLQTKCPAAIKKIYLGYDKKGKLSAAIAVKPIYTYTDVTGIIMLVKEGDVFKVGAVKIPDASDVSNKEKYKKLMKALKDIDGKIILDDSGKVQKIDAVTGATKYYSKIYFHFNIIAQNLLKVMQKGSKDKPVKLPKKEK